MRAFRPIAGVLLSAALLCAPLVGVAAAIELQARAQQRGAALTLADIAAIDGSAQERALLAPLPLPQRGRVGDTVTYSRAEIAQLVARAQPQLRTALRIGGAARVLVERRGQTLAAESLLQGARAQLVTALAGREGRIELRALSAPRSLLVPAGDLQMQARIDADIAPRMKVWLDIAVDGHPYTSVPVTFAVSWMKPALVLTRALPARAALSADAVATAEVDAAALGDALLQDAQRLSGKRLRRALAAGSAVSEDDLEPRPAIAAGAGVDVFAAVGRVVVQTRAIAERDGFVGQSIAARTLQSNEPLMIEVIGEDRAIVSNDPLR